MDRTRLIDTLLDIPSYRGCGSSCKLSSKVASKGYMELHAQLKEARQKGDAARIKALEAQVLGK